MVNNGSLTRKAFLSWQDENEKIKAQLEEENQRIAKCQSQLDITSKKLKEIDEKSSTASIERFLADTTVSLNNNTIVCSKAHILQLKKQQDKFNDEKYSFLSSLKDKPRELVEELTHSLKEFIKQHQEDYNIPQSSQFRYWLSEANREIDFISQLEQKESESEKDIFQQKLFQLVGYIHIFADNVTNDECQNMISLLDKYALAEEDCIGEFNLIDKTHFLSLNQTSFELFLKKEKTDLEIANQQLETLLRDRPQKTKEYNALYNKAEDVLKRVNGKSVEALDIKIKTKILNSTYDFLQTPNRSTLDKYRELANTVRRREGIPGKCINVAGVMSLLAGLMACFIGFVLLVSGPLTPALPITAGIGGGLLLFGAGLVCYNNRQRISERMKRLVP